MNKAKPTIKNIISYIQGNIRYKLFYSKYNWLIPIHIKEQIQMRIRSMKKECYTNGSCTMCGCRTTHLQMANKKCDGDCYPTMLSRKKYKKLIKNNFVESDRVLWKKKHNKFKKYE